MAVSDGPQAQVLDVAKGANPVNDIRVYECGRTRLDKGYGTCVVSKRVGRSGKICFCSPMVRFGGSNRMRAKRCFRDLEIHDLETMQHALSAAGSSYRWSTMISSSSDGKGRDVVVGIQDLDALPLGNGVLWNCCRRPSLKPSNPKRIHWYG